MAFLAGSEEPIDGQFDDDTFVGGLTDPFPVVVAASGELQIDLTAAGSPANPRAPVTSSAYTPLEGNADPGA